MKSVFKPVLLAGLMAAALATQAQPVPAPAPGTPGARPEFHERLQQRMQRHMDRRLADLQAKLKLGAEQNDAWTTYIAAMKPPAPTAHPSRAEMDQLTTPERLDRLRELRRQREAEMDRRDDATRAFYATLSAEQKKVFDANTGRPYGRRGERGPRRG
jgi:Spy/CpxP family protein refolding chaperone